MRVAVVGSGISGLMAAHLLQGEADVTVLEADGRPGGHAHTVEADLGRGPVPVDTGFIVYNPETYPTFVALLDELGVATKPTDMSFSVRCERTGLEYNGTSLNSLFAQRRNLARPSFWRMVRDILRFFRESPELLDEEGAGPTLGEYLRERRHGREFVEHHLVPMASAVWSAPPDALEAFPAAFLVRFFQRQGFLRTSRRPVWRTLVGGSRSYVSKLAARLGPRLRLDSPVRSIRRGCDGVRVAVRGQAPELYDHVVLAVHSDQALRLLEDPSPAERETLSALRYQENEAVLHLDEQLLPRRRLAWAAWNYHLPVPASGRTSVTYWMNALQGLEGDRVACVTLNRTGAIRADRMLRAFNYHHPAYTLDALAAQQRHAEISGPNRTHYCGAYWGHGFHEDGAASAVEAVRGLRRAAQAAARGGEGRAA